MILQSQTPKEIKSEFLSNNPKVHEIQDKNPAIGDFFSLNDDEEVWIMQCPKALPPSLLESHSIKLPGRTSLPNELETLAFEYAEPIPHAFAQKNKKGNNSVKILPVQGSIVLRNRLHVVTPPDLTETKIRSELVPMPKGIKERHPLHGVDYESKLEVSPQIAERLKQADEVTVQPRKSKKKKARKSSNNEASTIPVDSDGDIELVMQKKPKKKKNKRKHSAGDEVDEAPTKKKEKKKSLSEDVAEDLQWLQKL